LALMLLMAWVTHEPVPSTRALGWGAAAGVVGAFGLVCLYQALSIGRMGIVAPVAAVVSGILPVLLSGLVEGLPDRLQTAAFLLALVSIWLIARPDGQIDSHRGLGLATLAGIGFGLFLIAGKQAGHDGVFWPLVVARATSTLLMLIVVAVSVRDARSLRAAFTPILLAGLADSAGNALFVAATRHGRLDVAAVLSSLYPASTVILARVLLKERISPMQTAGIVGALASVAIISSH
jgi:drug/metabolite transporter (DMT)-like permease